ncbi:MAG TPA: hypothetical protein VI078_09540 [bacterium]
MNRNTTSGGATAAAVALGVFLALLAAGCASPQSHVVSAGFTGRLGEAKRVGVAVADAQIYRLEAAGGLVWDAAGSGTCRERLQRAVAREVAGRGLIAVELTVDDEVQALLKEYQQARGAILDPFAASGGQIAGVAPLPAAVRVASREALDAVVIVSGRDHVSTAGRQAMMGALLLLGVVGGKGLAYADLALIDPSGAVLFYDRKRGSQYNLTREDDVGNVCAELVGDYAQAKPAAP